MSETTQHEATQHETSRYEDGSGMVDSVAEVAAPDLKLAADRGIDVDAPAMGLKIAAERLSQVRYVFLVQVEDGIASAEERAALEYADAVLIGWPEADDSDVVEIRDEQYRSMVRQAEGMEHYISQFRRQEAQGDVEGMTFSLVAATQCVAQVRRMYQPSFPLPTFAEIRRVVQDEWDEDMGKIDPEASGTTVEAIEQQTEQADEQRQSDRTDGPDGSSKH